MVKFYRNLDRKDPYRKSFGYARANKVRFVWCGPITILWVP